MKNQAGADRAFQGDCIRRPPTRNRPGWKDDIVTLYIAGRRKKERTAGITYIEIEVKTIPTRFKGRTVLMGTTPANGTAMPGDRWPQEHNLFSS